jgi:hypothetical protein
MVEAAGESVEVANASPDNDPKRAKGVSPPSSPPSKDDKPKPVDESWDPCHPIPSVKERVLQGLFPRPRPPTSSRDEKDVNDLRNLANYDAIRQLVCLNRERFKWVKRMQGHLEDCCYSIQAMSYVSFVLGWLLIVIPLIMFFFSKAHDTSLLWFSGIGLAETLAILVYRPIDRVQEATSDMAQGTLIMNSWATEIGLILYLTDMPGTYGNPKETSAVVDLITKATGAHVEWFQKFTEARHELQKGEKKPDEEDKKPSTESESQKGGNKPEEKGKRDSAGPKAQQPQVGSDPKKKG